MRKYSVLQLILTFLPIIQHFQDAAHYSKNYSSIISSGLLSQFFLYSSYNKIHMTVRVINGLRCVMQLQMNREWSLPCMCKVLTSSKRPP